MYALCRYPSLYKSGVAVAGNYDYLMCLLWAIQMSQTSSGYHCVWVCFDIILYCPE